MLLQLHEPGQTPLPHQQAVVPAIGIDLGTTNSVIAVVQDGNVQFIPDSNGHILHPSVLHYRSGQPVTAAHAATRQQEGGVTLRSIKRLMGKSMAEARAEGTPWPLATHLPDDHAIATLSLPDNHHKTPVEISADLLAFLRTLASDYLQQDVTRAVVTVPAYFDEGARQATRDAARLAGLEVLRLVSEPTAAALAYGLDSGSEGLYAVYDLGGGTFDISLLRLEKGVFQVLATGGDASLGGDDFDTLLADSFLAHTGYDAPLPPEHRQRLLLAARQTREKLSVQDFADMVLWLPDRDCAHRFSRDDTDALFLPLVNRTLKACRHVLLDADIDASALQGVVLVGGTTRTPLIQQKVAEFFGKTPESGINPDTVVAAGAARQAHTLGGGEGTLLLDVIPLSLGLETMGGLAEKIIERNSVIPVARAQEFTTAQDNQTGMVIHVVQGEREKVEDCRSLARFTLLGIPPLPAGGARIRVTFTVDADGLLTVSATEQRTGVQQKVEVKPTYGLSDDDMKAMLYASYAHAREDMEARLLTTARVQAQQTLQALHKALTEDDALLSPPERAAIQADAKILAETMEKPSRPAILAAMERLEKTCQPFVEKRVNRALAQAVAGKSVETIESL